MRPFDLEKLWSDLSASAKEVAGHGLALGSRALELASAKLRTAKEKLEVKAEPPAAEPPARE